MSDVAEKAAEVTAEVVEESIDGVIETVEVVRNNPKAVIAGVVAGLAVGAGVGYFVAHKRLKSEFDDALSEEIDKTRAFYAELNKVGPDGVVLSPQEVLESRHGADAAAKALKTYQGRNTDPEDETTGPGSVNPYEAEQDERQAARLEAKAKEPKPPVEVEVQQTPESTEINVFVDDTFDMEEELKYRNDVDPFIITHDEYMENETNADQARLTYFETDDVLVDERDKPLDKINETIGDEHLARFGSGSKDKNVVYVRNPRLEIDYEITRSPGSYLEEVLGMPDEEPGELKHSNREMQQRRRREFRHGDG